MNRCDLVITCDVLIKKLWGKTLIDGKLRSERWWRQRLEFLINKEEDPIPPENLWDGKPVDYPIPYEVEFNMANKVDCLWMGVTMPTLDLP